MIPLTVQNQLPGGASTNWAHLSGTGITSTSSQQAKQGHTLFLKAAAASFAVAAAGSAKSESLHMLAALRVFYSGRAKKTFFFRFSTAMPPNLPQIRATLGFKTQTPPQITVASQLIQTAVGPSRFALTNRSPPPFHCSAQLRYPFPLRSRRQLPRRPPLQKKPSSPRHASPSLVFFFFSPPPRVPPPPTPSLPRRPRDREPHQSLSSLARSPSAQSSASAPPLPSPIPMGAVASTVAARFAFFPPTPPSYGVEPPPSPAAAAADSEVVELSGVPVSRGRGVEARRLPTKRGTEVVAMYVRQPGARLTLLYSHGNAADLGQMYELFVELSAHLNVNLMGYVTSALSIPRRALLLRLDCVEILSVSITL